MAEIFYLPSKELLRKIVQNIILKPGICNNIYEEIEARVSSFDDERYKYCILIFDEMKLDASFIYNSAADLKVLSMMVIKEQMK